MHWIYCILSCVSRLTFFNRYVFVMYIHTMCFDILNTVWFMIIYYVILYFIMLYLITLHDVIA